jgi:hypothetical protein
VRSKPSTNSKTTTVTTGIIQEKGRVEKSGDKMKKGRRGEVLRPWVFHRDAAFCVSALSGSLMRLFQCRRLAFLFKQCRKQRVKIGRHAVSGIGYTIGHIRRQCLHRSYRIRMPALTATDFLAGILVVKPITLAAFSTIYINHLRFPLFLKTAALLLMTFLLSLHPFFYFLPHLDEEKDQIVSKILQNPKFLHAMPFLR